MIGPFDGEYRFLSNYYNSPIEYEGYTYGSVEAAFQAQKTLDVGRRREFTRLAPNKAKALGRRVPLRSDWEDVKDEIMYNLVKIKFLSNPELRKKLLATLTEELVEVNTWRDTYWGQCEGKGQNKLGKILMKVREELRKS